MHAEQGLQNAEDAPMSVLFLIIPLAFLLAGGALAAFMYAVRQGQFDDLDTPSHRILFDDDEPAGPA